MLTQPVKVTVSAYSTCGSPMKAQVRFTQTLATAQPVTGTILFGHAGTKPVMTPFDLGRLSIGTTKQIEVTHPTALNCSVGLPDQSIEVLRTGVATPLLTKQLTPSKIMGEKKPSAPATPGPWVAKASIDAQCGAGGTASFHLERVGAGPDTTSVAVTIAGATTEKSVKVANINPIEDPSFAGPGPIDCKAATGLAPLSWSIPENGTTGSFGPTGFIVSFK